MKNYLKTIIKLKLISKSILLLSLSLLFVGCTGGVADIFYALATETTRGNNNLKDNLSTTNVVRDSSGNFYAAAGSLWIRSENSKTWNIVSNKFSGNQTDALILSITSTKSGADSGHFYAGFFFPNEPSGSRYGLYSTTPSGNTELTWTKVSDSNVSNAQIIKVFPMDDGIERLITITVTEDSESSDTFNYGLYFADDDDVSSFSVITDSSSKEMNQLFTAPSNIVHDGTNYWIAIGNDIYSGTSLENTLSTGNGPNENPTQGFADLFVSSSGWLYAADKNGYLYWKEPGDSWNKTNQIKVSSSIVQFSEFSQMNNQNIVIGTQGFGFYEFPNATNLTTDNVVRGPDFTVTNLYSAAIVRFASFFPNSNLVFALTSNSGIFSATWDNTNKVFIGGSPSANGKWDQE